MEKVYCKSDGNPKKGAELLMAANDMALFLFQARQIYIATCSKKITDENPEMFLSVVLGIMYAVNADIALANNFCQECLQKGFNFGKFHKTESMAQTQAAVPAKPVKDII